MGTGAYEIAAEVARKLRFTLVDGKCISGCASKYGLSQEMLQLVDEKPPSYITSEDRKRAAALNTIELIQREFARKGNVILYGRGGQYLLKECGNILRLRLTGEFEERVERLSEREWIDPDRERLHVVGVLFFHRKDFFHFLFLFSATFPQRHPMTNE
jgi:cytidylate kinase